MLIIYLILTLNFLFSQEHENNFNQNNEINNTIILPKLLAIKAILKPSYIEYKNITPIENTIIKPKKPSQEELLDDVLESIRE